MNDGKRGMTAGIIGAIAALALAAAGGVYFWLKKKYF